jgi:transposase
LQDAAVIRVQLPPAEADRLDTLFRSTDDRKLRDRLQIVLMAHRGRARRDIAADLGVNRRTVTRWVNTYLADGLDGLRPRKPTGKAGHIPADLADEVKRWVIDGPAKQGLDRANWTHAEIADHLLKARGIRTSRSAVQRFCSRIGIRPYRPTYRYLRGKPEKQAEARETLAALGNGRRPGRSSC